jgi:hypothetical protein
VGVSPLEGAGVPVGDGSATPHAADANSNTPAAAQPDRGKARTWHPLQDRSTRRAPLNAGLTFHGNAPRLGLPILITQCSRRDNGQVEQSQPCAAGVVAVYWLIK